MKILYFFLHLWVFFALLNPVTQMNADPKPNPQLCPKFFIIGKEALPTFASDGGVLPVLCFE
jgi:hypothetical protein